MYSKKKSGRNQTTQQRKAPSPVEFGAFDDDGPEENVLIGHPEVSDIFCQNYNHRDPQLEPETERMDITYVSPERQRLRTKYGTRF